MNLASISRVKKTPIVDCIRVSTPANVVLGEIGEYPKLVMVLKLAWR